MFLHYDEHESIPYSLLYCCKYYLAHKICENCPQQISCLLFDCFQTVPNYYFLCCKLNYIFVKIYV